MPPSTRYPGSRACLQCAKAKTKCVADLGSQNCSRCMRLRKDCHWRLSQEPKAKRLTRLGKVEQKVDDLLAAFNSNASNADDRDISEMQPLRCPFPTASNRISSLEPAIIEDLLGLFKRTKMPQFPFVIIPSHTSASELEKGNPFLFLVIMAMMLGESPAIQRVLKERIKTTVSQRALENIDHDLDFLQGLIIHIAWFHHSWESDAKQAHFLLQLADSIISDLGIHGFPIRDSDRFGFSGNQKKLPSASTTTAEYRAYLGFYYLKSSLMMLKAQVPTNNDKWVDHCCSAIFQEDHCSTDPTLRILVNICSLNNRIRKCMDTESSHASRKDGTIPQMLSFAFQREAGCLEEMILSPRNGVTHEVVLQQKLSKILSNSAALNWDSLLHVSEVHVIELCNLLSCCKNLIDYFNSIPLEAYSDLTFPALLLPWHSFVILSFLSCLPSSGLWDTSLAKQEASLHRLGEAVKSRFDSLANQSASTGKTLLWSRLSSGMSALFRWYQNCEFQAGHVQFKPPNTDSSLIHHLVESCSLFVRMESSAVAQKDARETPHAIMTSTSPGIEQPGDVLANFNWQEFAQMGDTTEFAGWVGF